ncbi:MAG: response regulator [Persicimonas sp.]
MRATHPTKSGDLGVLDRWTERCLPEEFEGGSDEMFRARVVVALSWAISIFGPIYAAILYLLTGSVPQVIATLAATAGVIATPLLMRRGFPFVVLGNWLTLCGYALFVYVASQELGPSVLIWQVVFAILAALTAGRRSALVWLGIMSATTAYFYLSLVEAGGEEGALFTPTQLLWEMSIIIGMFVAVMILTLSYDSLKDWALEKFRRKEAQTRAIVESAPDGIITLTEDGRIDEFNAAAEDLFGYHHTSVDGAPLTTLVPALDGAPPTADREGSNDDLFADTQDDEDLGAKGLEAWHGQTFEVEGVRRDGRRFPAELSLTPIEEDGRIVAIVRDITTRKQAERALRDARDRAVEASEAKSRFLANTSHELRTPLNAIIGYSELVSEDLDLIGEEELGKDVRQILRAGKHLLSLINEILDLAKVEAGKMELHIEEVDVRELVDELTATAEPLARDNDNKLRVDIDDAPEKMHIDRRKLRQILLNLLSNACKFTQDAYVRIHAFAEQRDGKEWGVFEVIDRGIGIPEEKLESLFEAFTQADASTTREFGGTGLGLTLCKEFTEMMHGEIDVESKVGEGSTFRVKFPVDVERAQDAGEGERENDELDIDIPAGLSEESRVTVEPDAPCVLVVDDDPTVHQLLERFLAREGFAVEASTGGEEAIELARRVEPDVITLDVLMPEMDGWSMLERIKSDKDLCDIPVVMLTIVSDRNTGFSLGASEYLTKPVDSEALLEVLSRHIDAQEDAPVLIAEDVEATRDVLRRTLEDAGFETVCAADGGEALDHLEEGLEPGAILLDLMMPRVDGFELLERMRQKEDWSKIPVIVVTAADLSQAERQQLEAGVERILAKGDFSHEQLVAELHAALERGGSEAPTMEASAPVEAL